MILLMFYDIPCYCIMDHCNYVLFLFYMHQDLLFYKFNTDSDVGNFMIRFIDLAVNYFVMSYKRF